MLIALPNLVGIAEFEDRLGDEDYVMSLELEVSDSQPVAPDTSVDASLQALDLDALLGILEIESGALPTLLAPPFGVDAVTMNGTGDKGAPEAVAVSVDASTHSREMNVLEVRMFAPESVADSVDASTQFLDMPALERQKVIDDGVDAEKKALEGNSAGGDLSCVCSEACVGTDVVFCLSESDLEALLVATSERCNVAAQDQINMITTQFEALKVQHAQLEASYKFMPDCRKVAGLPAGGVSKTRRGGKKSNVKSDIYGSATKSDNYGSATKSDNYGSATKSGKKGQKS